MKKTLILCISLISMLGVKVNAQDNNDCEIPMMVYISDQGGFPQSANKLLYNKLHRVAVENGISSEGYAQFLISSNFTILDKTILAGPPRSFVYDFEVNLFIGDYFGQKIFSSTTINLKGVGQNETKAYIDAVKKIKPKSSELQDFLVIGKAKIIDYYNTQFPTIIKKSMSLSKQKQFGEAMFNLMAIPECCEGYDEAMKAAEIVYQAYVDELCVQNLSKAKMAWVSQQDASGARDAGQYLANIYPDAKCYKDAEVLYKEIKAKVREDWDFVLRMYDDAVDLEEQRIDAWREVGVAFGKNQQAKTTEIVWTK